MALTDDNLRENLLANGRERLKIFDKNRIKDEYLKVFKEILGDRK